MRNLHILHSADWHITDANIEEAETCLGFLVHTATAEDVDLIVIPGDIFNSQDVRLDSRAAKLAACYIAAMARICPVVISIGTPSHEGMATELFSYIPGVYVSTKPEQVFLQDGRIVPFEDGLDGADCLLSILPTPTKRFMQGSNEEIAAAMSGIFAGFAASAFAASFEGPHILVFHGAIGGASLPNNQLLIGKDIEISVDQLALGNFDIVCLGHIHLPQQLGKDGQPGGNAFYSGSLFPTNWGEAEHKHGFWIHQIEKESPMPELNYSEFVETPHKRMIRIKEDWTNDQPQEPISLDGMDGAYVRYDITCWQDEAAGIDKEAIKKSFTEAGALDVDIRINRIPRENIRAEAVLKADLLRDKLIRQAELRGETVGESILLKADLLESMEPDRFIAQVTGMQEVEA